MAELRLETPCDPSGLRAIARDLIAARAILLHFVRETLRCRHPEVDADSLLAEACYNFGRYNSGRYGDCAGAGDFLAAITTKAGVLAWDQQLVELGDDRAVKTFSSCPHAEALLALGHSPEETAHFCRNVMMHADFGLVSGYPHLRLSFPEATVAEGGKCRRMVIERIDRESGG